MSRFRFGICARLVMSGLLAAVCLGARVSHAQIGQPGEVVPPVPMPQQNRKMSVQDASAQLRLAEVYEQTRDLQNAVRLYQEIYQQHPEQHEAFEGLIRGFWYLKRYADLETLVADRVKQEPDNTDLLLTYARTEARLNKKDDALKVFDKAKQSVARMGDVDCGMFLNVANAMVEVSYNEEAIELLENSRKPDDFSGICASQIATIYLRMGRYGDAAKQYLGILKQNEGYLGLVQQRLNQFMTDSVARASILTAIEQETNPASSPLQALQLLVWLYGEQKLYARAYTVELKIDDLNTREHPQSSGYELLTFAERARNEGALDVAVTAYDEAIRRLNQNNSGQQVNYFIAQAELGALRTREAFLKSKQSTDAEVADLIGRYESFAERQSQGEFSADSYLHAGQLAMSDLFDLQRAQKSFEKAIAKSRSFTDRVRDAYFGLVDVALANKDFRTAGERLDRIQQALDQRGRSTDKETPKRLLYVRALSEYYQMHFDSSLAILSEIVEDASSDYANDAIQLADIISENSKPATLGALHLFANASLSETAHEYEAALKDFRSIFETNPSAALADDAVLHAADIELKLGRAADAVKTLEGFEEKMVNSPVADQAAFRAAKIVEQQLKDKARAQRMYEEFLVKYSNSTLTTEARERARKLRGDTF